MISVLIHEEKHNLDLQFCAAYVSLPDNHLNENFDRFHRTKVFTLLIIITSIYYQMSNNS